MGREFFLDLSRRGSATLSLLQGEGKEGKEGKKDRC
jgi:hypothetical protein